MPISVGITDNNVTNLALQLYIPASVCSCSVLHRLVTLISTEAKLFAGKEAAIKQAKSASEAAQRLMSQQEKVTRFHLRPRQSLWWFLFMTCFLLTTSSMSSYKNNLDQLGKHLSRVYGFYFSQINVSRLSYSIFL